MSKNNNINKKDKTKLSNTFIIIGIVFLIASLVFMFVKSDKKGYIKEIGYSEYTDIIQKDEYSIILLTSPTCAHCNSYKPYVNFAASEYDLKVYNIDLTSLEYEEYVNLHDKYTVIKDQFSDNEPMIPTPVTLIVRNGEEVTSTLGNIGYDGFIRLLKNNGIIK